MGEKITPKRVLDTLATRKPSGWTDCILHTPTNGQVKYLQDLPLFFSEVGYEPMRELLPRDQHGLKYRMPDRFLLCPDGKSLYYINTEGYAYCRYALGLDAVVVFPEGFPVAGTPIIPAQLPEPPEPIVEDIKEPIKAELKSDAKMLVLAAKALTCYLEYKEHPEGCRLLVKMLNEAIKDYENE